MFFLFLAIFPAFISVHLLCNSCAILWGQNFLRKQAGLFSFQKNIQKGCFVRFELYKALFASSRTLWNNFDSKGYKELLKRDVWNSILQNTPFTAKLWVLWSRQVLQNEKVKSSTWASRTLLSLEAVSQLVTYSSQPQGCKSASQLYQGRTHSRDSVWSHFSVDWFTKECPS